MAIIRIVRLSFNPDRIHDFIEIFHQSENAIREFDGCTYLELMRDPTHPNVYYTYSRWLSVAHLDRYRQSSFFEQTWAKTKVLFNDKPQAFSLEGFKD
jgi:quinol monooxygenase YgiN